ncbi:MAG: hypothetical protein WAM73_11140, partial [Desulfobacterales bacterium]
VEHLYQEYLYMYLKLYVKIFKVVNGFTGSRPRFPALRLVDVMLFVHFHHSKIPPIPHHIIHSIFQPSSHSVFHLSSNPIFSLTISYLPSLPASKLLSFPTYLPPSFPASQPSGLPASQPFRIDRFIVQPEAGVNPANSVKTAR